MLIASRLGWEDTPSIMKYGPRLRKQRKLMQERIGSQEALESYKQLQLSETYKLLAALVHSPSNYMKHIRK